MKSPGGSERGFTLIELTVAVVAMSTILIAIFMAFFRANDESQRITKLMEYRQSARGASQLLDRDVRMAGSGWGRNRLNVRQGGANLEWWAVMPGNGAGNSDSVVVIGAMGTAATLSQKMDLWSSTLKVTSATGFAANDLVVVTDGTAAHLFQATAVNQGTGVITHSTSSGFNDPSANWPATGYPVGSTQVYKVTRLAYRLDSLNFGRPCLVRQEFGQSPQVVAYDLNQFQVWYRMQDGTMTRDPVVFGTGVALINNLQPRIHTRVTTPGKPTLLDSVWSEVMPRTFN